MIVQRLRHMRAKSGLTQQQVADHLNISRGAVGHWETGKNIPSYDVLVTMAKLYNTTAAYLIGETDNPYRNQSTLLHDQSVGTPRGADTASHHKRMSPLPDGGTHAPARRSLRRDGMVEADDVEVLSATKAWKQLAPDAQDRVRRLIYVLGREVFQDAVQEHFSRKYAAGASARAHDGQNVTDGIPTSLAPSETVSITLDYGTDAMAIFYAIFGLDGHEAPTESPSTTDGDDNARSVAERSPSSSSTDTKDSRRKPS